MEEDITKEASKGEREKDIGEVFAGTVIAHEEDIHGVDHEDGDD